MAKSSDDKNKKILKLRSQIEKRKKAIRDAEKRIESLKKKILYPQNETLNDLEIELGNLIKPPSQPSLPTVSPFNDAAILKEDNLFYHIRWMIRRDFDRVFEIENKSFEFPWTEEEFLFHLRKRDHIGMVIEYDEQVVGFMVYELHSDRLSLLNIAVHPDARRRGAGQKMLEKLKGKLSPRGKNSITLEVREANLAAQQFFKSSGLRAVSILRDYYDDTLEDAYVMRYAHPELRTAFDPHNRTSRHLDYG